MNPYVRGYPQPTQPTTAAARPGRPTATMPGGRQHQCMITLVCRAVNLSSVDPSANSEIAFEVERELKSATNYFDPKTTSLTTPDHHR